MVRFLLEEGDRVRVLDDLSTGHRANLAGVGVELVEGDVRDLDLVRRACRGTEVVYHLAALPSVARSLADPGTTNDVNVRGTLTVLLAARAEGVRRVVYASSSSIYGDAPTLPKEEGMPPLPRSPYAAAKLAGEAYCRAFTASLGLETVSLRFFNVFGPRQDPASPYAAVIPRFASRMLAGEPPVIFGDGLQSRDFTYVANAVRACRLAALADGEVAGEVVNVACGGRISLLELVALLNRIIGTHLEPVFTDPQPGDVRHSEAAIGKARRLLGYRPEVGVEEGLAETVAWLARAAPVGGAP
ncbi:MAG TPA: NAD-dependent epimerase/dehydratase family protein [Actinomycetota bacterium]|nr:NAD-dependent epimerase/dehydratase family protein [Actinomycetota bacterium]